MILISKLSPNNWAALVAFKNCHLNNSRRDLKIITPWKEYWVQLIFKDCLIIWRRLDVWKHKWFLVIALKNYWKISKTFILFKDKTVVVSKCTITWRTIGIWVTRKHSSTIWNIIIKLLEKITINYYLLHSIFKKV